MGAFGNSYSDQTSQPSSAPNPTMATPSQSASSASSAPTAPAIQGLPDQGPPGFDLVDGIVGVVLAPGRAIVAQFHPPTMKDLIPMLAISGVAWYLLYRFAWPHLEAMMLPAKKEKS